MLHIVVFRPAGTRHLAAARAVGQGTYALAEHKDHVKLLYRWGLLGWRQACDSTLMGAAKPLPAVGRNGHSYTWKCL